MRRVAVVGVVAVAALAAGCSGDDPHDDGSVTELELTRVTAPPGSDPAGQLACMLDASHLRGALEAYELDNGGPAADETALLEGRYVVVESSLWDVEDGTLIAQDPACEDVPPDVPAAEIVTEQTGEALDEIGDELAATTPDDIVAALSRAEIDAVGGPECALEVAEVGLAFGRWLSDEGAEPPTLTALVDAGYMEPLELWVIGETGLTPASGSGCVGPIDVLDG